MWIIAAVIFFTHNLKDILFKVWLKLFLQNSKEKHSNFQFLIFICSHSAKMGFLTTNSFCCCLSLKMGGYVLGFLAIFLCVSGTVETTRKYIENSRPYPIFNNEYTLAFTTKMGKNPPFWSKQQENLFFHWRPFSVVSTPISYVHFLALWHLQGKQAIN